MLSKINFKFFVALFLVCVAIAYTPSTDVNAADVPRFVGNPVNLDPKQLHCMAKNIFYEASGESIHGQAAVARVVLNRVAHGFAKTPCGVIYQTNLVNDVKVCQFSWVCENKGEPNINSYQYKLAKQIAYEVMVHDRYADVIPKSVLFFHNLTVSPLWPYAEALKIGNHIFYSKIKKKNGIQPKKKVSSQEDI